MKPSSYELWEAVAPHSSKEESGIVEVYSSTEESGQVEMRFSTEESDRDFAFRSWTYPCLYSCPSSLLCRVIRLDDSLSWAAQDSGHQVVSVTLWLLGLSLFPVSEHTADLATNEIGDQNIPGGQRGHLPYGSGHAGSSY